MLKLVVLGSGGQLGQELVARAPQFSVAIQGYTRSDVDVANQQHIGDALAAVGPDVVINAAAYTKVDKAECAQEEAFRTNAIGPGILARACAARDIPLIHISTDYVFDGCKRGPYQEDDPIDPLGVYGLSKAAGEAAIRRETDRYLMLRTSWVYGVYGANFLKTMLRLAREREQISVVSDQHGCPTSTVDLAEAILRLAPVLKGDKTVCGTYHFAGTGATSWDEFAREIIALQARFTGREPVVVPIPTSEYPTPARRPTNSELDCSRFAATFGFRAKVWQERTREAVVILCS